MDSIILPDPESTRAFGAAWAERCQGGEVFALHGPIGAGKTELARGLARGLGFPGEVTSPTFSILHEYRGGRLPFYHLDLYRMGGEEETRRVGLEEYLEEGVVLIEWPDPAKGLLPKHAEHWQIEPLPDGKRRILRLP